MDSKCSIFYRGKQQILSDFSGAEISSDGAVVLLEKLERRHKVIENISKVIPDKRDPLRIVHSVEKLLKQRVFLMMQGYEDANDVKYLKNDPLLKDILEGDLASQSTVSRFENSVDRQCIFDLCNAWIDRYVSTLKGRSEIIIDIDSTDDPTYGNQQLSMFSGFYSQYMYNELFFHDGTTGQIIVPVLRPGNSHSNKWYVAILKRVIKKIRSKFPEIEIYIRADSGFSCPPFYQLADDFWLKYAVGIATNSILKTKVLRAENAVNILYLSNKEKHQHFLSYTYQAATWHKEQQCYAKVESTGQGLNTRHIVSNLDEMEAREIYFDYYVKRGDASENRIKEVKNMCFSGRLSNHEFWANFLRLLISCLAYEMFRLIKSEIAKTKNEVAKKWQISTIRVSLLKIGATIKKTKRRIYYQLSRAFAHQELFREIIINI